MRVLTAASLLVDSSFNIHNNMLHPVCQEVGAIPILAGNKRIGHNPVNLSMSQSFLLEMNEFHFYLFVFVSNTKVLFHRIALIL